MSHVMVLFHGSCHGPWCWDAVVTTLAERGVTAIAPALSMEPGTTLSDHIAAAQAALPADATQLTLVGHSYAGMLLADVAAADSRVTTCVYLDAFVPAPGESAFDLLGPIGADLRAFADADPTHCFPPPPAAAFGVTDDAIAALLDARLVPMPAGTHTQAVVTAAVDTNGASQHDRWISRFVWCARFPAFAGQAERARTAGWPVEELDADHEVMLTAPSLLVGALIA
jgi:pimeloyl-ACP methyl ester carboxylesterase